MTTLDDRALREPLCFHCGAPAAHEFEAYLTRAYSESILVLDRSPITATIYTCADCTPAAEDYLLDTFGAAGGTSLIVNTCDDLFHTGMSQGISTFERHGAWGIGGYECPTCGFRTAGSEIRESDPNHPAYVALAVAFGEHR